MLLLVAFKLNVESHQFIEFVINKYERVYYYSLIVFANEKISASMKTQTHTIKLQAGLEILHSQS